MDRYRITYKDCGDINVTTISAYDYDHAEEIFWESIEEWQDDTIGIEIEQIVWLKN
jgi:predicted metallo-beta-lactamase superfamily hydrolase